MWFGWSSGYRLEFCAIVYFRTCAKSFAANYLQHSTTYNSTGSFWLEALYGKSKMEYLKNERIFGIPSRKPLKTFSTIYTRPRLAKNSIIHIHCTIFCWMFLVVVYFIILCNPASKWDYKLHTIHCKENWEKIFPKRKLRGLSPNFYIHIFPQSNCLFGCSKIGGPNPGNIYQSLTDVWTWKLGTRPRSLISGNT